MPSHTSAVVQRIAREVDTVFLGGGHPSSWHQNSYKSTIFDLFRDNQTLTGDKMREYAHDFNLWATDERASEKRKIFEDICSAWDEWQYAVSHISPA